MDIAMTNSILKRLSCLTYSRNNPQILSASLQERIRRVLLKTLIHVLYIDTLMSMVLARNVKIPFISMLSSKQFYVVKNTASTKQGFLTLHNLMKL